MTNLTYDMFDFGDERLSERHQKILKTLSKDSQKAFPQVFKNNGELEGFYRFINNDRVQVNSLLDPFYRQTVQKLQGESANRDIVVPHDTTLVSPKSNQNNLKGLNRTHGKHSAHGFFAHLSLAIEPKNREILGPLRLDMWTRRASKDEEKQKSESDRWFKNIEVSEISLGMPGRLIHVADREADSYNFYEKLVKKQYRFVIRNQHNRILNSETGEKLFDLLKSAPVLSTREIELFKREQKLFKKSKNKIHPDRSKRTALLEISAVSVTLIYSPKRKKKDIPSSVDVNVVHVKETNPPAGEAPIEWCLVTSEKIETASDVDQIIDWYRCRWVIEEFFKALKTGCSLEKRLFDEAHSWFRLVALLVPIACKLYNLKTKSLLPAGQQDLKDLSTTQLEILKISAFQNNRPLNDAVDVLNEIARLGGHIKYSGPPGWITLFRGMQELLTMEIGYKLRSAAICDRK